MSARGRCAISASSCFSHMESLPIRYFDTHAHGDIMSVYTNDVDTLRQLISQSIPQVINSVVTHCDDLCEHAGSGYPADTDYPLP